MGRPAPLAAIDGAIEVLLRQGELRVWSLIVTLLGDLAREEGAYLTGPALTAITGRIGIKPGAKRVALHRLRRDGWVESTKAGRTSRYALTTFGRAQSAAASARIYAAAPPKGAPAHLLLAEPQPRGAQVELDARLLAEGYLTLRPGCYLGRGAAPEAADFLVFDGNVSQVPGWLRSQLMPERLVRAYAGLEQALEQVAAVLDPVPEMTPTDIAALRGLVVHAWRRILLRHPDLPEAFLPPACRIAACRERVQHLLAQLPRPGLEPPHR